MNKEMREHIDNFKMFLNKNDNNIIKKNSQTEGFFFYYEYIYNKIFYHENQ